MWLLPSCNAWAASEHQRHLQSWRLGAFAVHRRWLLFTGIEELPDMFQRKALMGFQTGIVDIAAEYRYVSLMRGLAVQPAAGEMQCILDDPARRQKLQMHLPWLEILALVLQRQSSGESLAGFPLLGQSAKLDETIPEALRCVLHAGNQTSGLPCMSMLTRQGETCVSHSGLNVSSDPFEAYIPQDCSCRITLASEAASV